MRGSAKFELILFYDAGATPMEMMEKGYPKSTCYKYVKYWTEARRIFESKGGRKK